MKKLDERQKALVATAESYFARGVYLQYDDTRAVSGNVVKPPVYRWARYYLNSPEDTTSQNITYTNCAKFTYDVYMDALGLDIVNWCTEMLIRDGTQEVYRYEVKFDETPERKELVERTFTNALRVGDIIVNRHVRGGGHAMLYMGNGNIIHSMGSRPGNYNYTEKKDYTEPYGTVVKMTVKDLFTPGHLRYVFTEELNLQIIRPLTKFTDAAVTENAMARMKNLMGIYAEKLCSHTIGQTVDLGEEMTFSYYIRNDRDNAVKVLVTDEVPEKTEYISGGDIYAGGKLRWNINLASGAATTVSYTVRVKNDPALYGSYIQGAAGKVNGVSFRCPAVTVGKNLSADKQQAVAQAASKLAGSTLCGTELAAKVYADAGINTALDSAEAILSDLFVPYKGVSDTHFELNTNGKYINMLAPIMYGGRVVDTSDKYLGRRTDGIFAHQISAGDVLVCTENQDNSSAEVYIFCGDGMLAADKNGAKYLNKQETDDVLMSVMGYCKFALVRPAMQ
ncbi:MAG: DUF11 domain-containing protein [Clostridia bacterium]|nr:DUF11 domain-containing protein [Clostridia bacterium]